MKSLTVTLFVVGMFLATPARADDVEVYGNMFAVETTYTTGSSISPGGARSYRTETGPHASG